VTKTELPVQLLDEISTADVVDAMGRFHRHRCHILDLISPTPDRRLFGPVRTISYFPTCGEALDPDRFNFADLFHQAAGEEPAGEVLVLASNGHPDVSLGGGTKLSRLQNTSMAGVLADGRLRDFEELARYDFATYCRGESTRWGGDTVTPFQANVPVVIAGVGIYPGDYVFADSSGAAVIPAAQVEEILEEAANVEREDAGYLEMIKEESHEGGDRDRR
jgi:regulator of RNase E activity RraA